jgi:peptide deformylase
MAVREILLLGNPVLRTVCGQVSGFSSPDVAALAVDLRDTLENFRNSHGFGRGIAAPQIGSTQRMIYLNFGTPQPLINPEIIHRSRARMLLWDDCFSFPELMVKVSRHVDVDVSYQDLGGKRHTMHCDGGLSELVQHEIDHLNGILAIDRAIDSRHIVFRSQLDKLEHESSVSL